MNMKCKNMNINIRWDKNSCYIDSLIVSLLYNNDNRYLLEAKVNDYGDRKILKMGNDIQKGLIKLDEIINGRSKVDGKNEMCKMRENIDKYYRYYSKINKNIRLIERGDNWVNSQIDVFELFELFKIIFDIRPTLEIKEGKNKVIKTTFDYMIPTELLMDNKEVKIREIMPKYMIKYKLSKKDGWRDSKGKMRYVYKNRVEIKKGDKLFIKIYRNIGIEKLDTRIKVSNTLKLEGNEEKLKIKSIIIHYGTKDGGHYICLIKCGNKWYEYDDMRSGMKCVGTLVDINRNNEYKENIVGLIYT
jgi:hypothetical protein